MFRQNTSKKRTAAEANAQSVVAAPAQSAAAAALASPAAPAAAPEQVQPNPPRKSKVAMPLATPHSRNEPKALINARERIRAKSRSMQANIVDIQRASLAVTPSLLANINQLFGGRTPQPQQPANRPQPPAQEQANEPAGLVPAPILPGPRRQLRF